MICEGFDFDRITCICMMKVYANMSLLDVGMRFHMFIMENEMLSQDQRVRNSVLDMYCKCQRIQRAQNAFDTSTIRNVVSWNIMINGYAQCEDCDQVMKLFYEMHSYGIEPNSTTFISILKVCSSVLASLEGKLIHLYVMENSIEVDMHIVSALIDMYSKSGAIEDAYILFSKSSVKDVVTWSALIGGCVFQGLCIEALDLFEEMRHNGIEPNDVTYLSIIKACTSMISLDHGKRIHNYIKSSNSKMVTSVGNALMDMYIKCGSLTDAHDVFEKLTQRSVVTWSTLIAGDVEHGFCEEALQHFRDMQKEGFEASNITIAYVLKACSVICALDQAKLVHAYSIEISLVSDVLVANTLVYMYIKCGSFEDACNTFNDSLDLDVVTWSAMIAGCSNYQQAIQYFKSMLSSGIRPNDVTFIGLLSACCQAGCVNEGCHHFKSMTLDYNIVASAEHYNCMVDLLARSGFLVEAKMMLLTMPFDPDIKVWTSLLSHSKVLGEASLGKRCFDTVNIVDVVEADNT